MRNTTSEFRRDECGAVAIIFGLSVFILLSVVALTLTFADAFNIKSKTQQALDAAVLAGASLGFDSSDDYRISIAQKVYANNGSARADGNPNLSVQQLPPATFTTSDTMVFGEINFLMRSPFLGVFGERAMTIHVASAARKAIGTPICVLGLDPTEDATMDFNGKASLEVNNCATQANSSSGSGLNQVGHPTMKAKEIGVTGGFTGSAYTPPPITGSNPVPDPYASLPVPRNGACHPMSGAKLQQTTIALTPGTYCGGLDVKASSVVTLSPGIYVFKDGPLAINSQSSVSGSEVLLAFLGKSSTLSMNGGATLAVTSPTTGVYANIQFFGDRSTYRSPGGNGANGDNLWFTVIGDSALTYDGALYTPSFHAWFAGGSIIEGKSPSYIAVAKKLWFQDNTQVKFTQVNTRGLTVDAAIHLQYGARIFR